VFKALCVEHDPTERGATAITDGGGTPILPRPRNGPRRVPQSILSIFPKFLARINARIPLPGGAPPCAGHGPPPGSRASVDRSRGRGLPDGELGPQIFTLENKSEIEKSLAFLHKSPWSYCK
jgi:hypothetical protein